jgi:hypothetical protein
VASNVGLLKQRESGDAAAGKLVPARIANGMKIHFTDQMGEQGVQRRTIRQCSRVARMRFHDPLAA